MDIIDKLVEAEQQPQKAIALGIAVLSGYERVNISEYCEMYYLLRKWQKKLGIGTLKSLDDIVDKYNACFEANKELEPVNEYVEQREFVDELSDGRSCVRDVLTFAQEADAAEPAGADVCNNTMPDFAAETAPFAFPIYIDPTKPVS